MTRRSGRGFVLAVGLTAIGVPAAAASAAGLLAYAPAIETPHEGPPAIVLHAPSDGGTYVSPLGIDVGFKPAFGSEIDLSTLKVTVVTHTLLGDLAFDITDDVSPYASPSGIHVWCAGIPAGEHTVTISIADTLQRRAEQELTITVRDERAPGD